MPSEPRHYWDSCLFIDYLNNTPDRADILQTLLDRASRNGPASIVVSAIAKVEVAFAAQERSTRIIDPEVEQAIDALWAQPCIEVVELHDHIARGGTRRMSGCRSAKRAVRLLAIRDALHERPHTVQQLATLLQVSDDAVRNDLVDLQLPPLSVPLQVDERGRWYVGDPMND